MLGKAVDPAQLPWGQGAVSNAEWTGVSLSTVLDLAEVSPDAVDVMPVGLDEQHVARPMPLDIARRPQTLLAYAMNGDPLPPDNGYPVRAIVPGWIGTNSIKWVGQIVVSKEPLKVKWNTASYAMHGPDYPDDPALTFQPVKSVVALPWEAKLKAGPQTVRGFAWSPYGKVAKVEYSLDGGKELAGGDACWSRISRSPGCAGRCAGTRSRARTRSRRGRRTSRGTASLTR